MLPEDQNWETEKKLRPSGCSCSEQRVPTLISHLTHFIMPHCHRTSSYSCQYSALYCYCLLGIILIYSGCYFIFLYSYLFILFKRINFFALHISIDAKPRKQVERHLTTISMVYDCVCDKKNLKLETWGNVGDGTELARYSRLASTLSVSSGTRPLDDGWSLSYSYWSFSSWKISGSPGPWLRASQVEFILGDKRITSKQLWGAKTEKLCSLQTGIWSSLPKGWWGAGKDVSHRLCGSIVKLQITCAEWWK